jgi:hypothetical protein
VDTNERDHNVRDLEKELAEFEQKLGFAMRRREAPLGLKTRVMARARERRQAGRSRVWMLQRLAASVVLAALCGGGVVYHNVEERRKGEAARDQVMTAMRIANRSLEHVNHRLADSSR